MGIDRQESSQGGAQPDAKPDLKEIVLGLHWDPPERGAAAQAADLDALCVLFDAQDRVVEVIHPGHARNADGSVVHTGDSRTGPSRWDDERIFVFLDALPQTVSRVALLVISATGHAFDEVRGACCHVSDRASEDEWLRLDLAALAGRTSHAVASLQRGAAGWSMAIDPPPLEAGLLAELRALTGSAKRAEGAKPPGDAGRVRF